MNGNNTQVEEKELNGWRQASSTVSLPEAYQTLAVPKLAHIEPLVRQLGSEVLLAHVADG